MCNLLLQHQVRHPRSSKASNNFPLMFSNIEFPIIICAAIDLLWLLYVIHDPRRFDSRKHQFKESFPFITCSASDLLLLLLHKSITTSLIQNLRLISINPSQKNSFLSSLVLRHIGLPRPSTVCYLCCMSFPCLLLFLWIHEGEDPLTFFQTLILCFLNLLRFIVFFVHDIAMTTHAHTGCWWCERWCSKSLDEGIYKFSVIHRLILWIQKRWMCTAATTFLGCTIFFHWWYCVVWWSSVSNEAKKQQCKIVRRRSGLSINDVCVH